MFDHFTKWPEACVLPKKKASEVAKALFINWYSRFGSPATITTDNERTLIHESVNIISTMLGAKSLRTTIYHPDGNSPVERFHKELKRVMKQLKPLAEEVLNVDEAIHWALMMYRTLPHSTTNQSPAFMTHGHDIVIQDTWTDMMARGLCPTDNNRNNILQAMRQDVINKYINMVKSYNNKIDNKSNNNAYLFKLGDLVLLQLTDNQISHLTKALGYGFKLTSKWSLPMRVTFVNRYSTTATLKCTSSGFTTQAHASRVQPIIEPTSEALKAEWKLICSAEVNAFQLLDSYLIATMNSRTVPTSRMRTKYPGG